MPDSGLNQREHFIKQRRNLVLISIFIIFYKVGELDIKQLNFLGNITTIGNQAVIGFVLGLFFVYFLYRYYLACRDVEGFKRFIRSTRDFANFKMSQHLNKEIQKQYVGNGGTPYIVQRGWFKIVYSGRVQGANSTEYGGQPMEEKKFDIGKEFYHVRLFSPLYALVNRGEFSEYIVPYLLAGLVVADFFGASLVERFMGLFGFHF